MNKIKRALISVSDKTGIAEFAQALHAGGIEILSTGGTASLLADSGIPVIEVSDYTGFPEMMAGRVKTLHPKIHGGILARRGTDEAVMAENDIGPIDLVVVNLYPFEQTVARDDCDLPMAIENIDIGGPTLLRAAAKNHAAVTVVVDSVDYAIVVSELQANDGAVSDATRYALAVKTFEHTARYDGGSKVCRHTKTTLDMHMGVDKPRCNDGMCQIDLISRFVFGTDTRNASIVDCDVRILDLTGKYVQHPPITKQQIGRLFSPRDCQQIRQCHANPSS